MKLSIRAICVKVIIAIIVIQLGAVQKNATAQDFHLSQFDAFQQYFNPAMTGMFNGDLRVNAHFRQQWASIIENPYQTFGVSLDAANVNLGSFPPALQNLRLGGFVLNYQAGAGTYNVLNVIFSVAKNYAIKQSDHHVAVGIQTGVINKFVNMDALSFQRQYNNANGGGFNTQIPNGENFTNTSVFLPELNTGLLYNYAKLNSRFNPFLGVAAYHLTQPNETFFNVTNRLPIRFVLNTGSKINIHKQHQAHLHVLTMMQKNVIQVQSNIMGNFFISPNSEDIAIIYGFSYRTLNNSDAGIIHLGAKYRDFTGRVSYDINISDLKNFSSGRGAIEISLVYIRTKPIKAANVSCPRL